VDEIGEGVSGRLGPSSSQARQAGENSLRLDEVDVPDLTAIPPVPAKGCTLEPRRLRVEQEQDELERIRQPDVPEVRRGGKGNPRVPGVERTTEAAVGGAL
jgi:hypothetical protein